MNKDSYSDTKTVDYYMRLGEHGLFNYERKIVEEFFPSHSKIIDIGCGTGRTTNALWAMKYDVVGIDYSEEMIESARAFNPNIIFKVQDARKLEFDDCQFDNALFSFNGIMLIETYNERLTAMREVNRILSSNGLFFFTTPFIDNKVHSEYWSRKIQATNKSLDELSFEDKLRIGDDIIEDGGCQFQIHVPFVSEVEKMIIDSGFIVEKSCRRLDVYEEEELEDELDDNYVWVVRK